LRNGALVHTPSSPVNLKEFNMEPVQLAEAFKYLGAGLACIGMGVAALAVGNIFGNFLSGALRNPTASDGQFARAFIGAALAEGLGIFCLVVALVLLFVV